MVSYPKITNWRVVNYGNIIFVCDVFKIHLSSGPGQRTLYLTAKNQCRCSYSIKYETAKIIHGRQIHTEKNKKDNRTGQRVFAATCTFTGCSSPAPIWYDFRSDTVSGGLRCGRNKHDGRGARRSRQSILLPG